MIKSKDLQPRLLDPASLSFKIEVEIRSFLDKKILSEFITTKQVLQQMLKGLPEGEEERRGGGEIENYLKNKMAINMNLSIIILNVS